MTGFSLDANQFGAVCGFALPSKLLRFETVYWNNPVIVTTVWWNHGATLILHIFRPDTAYFSRLSFIIETDKLDEAGR